MITIDTTPKLKQNGAYEISFKGLSTDNKPTVKYNNVPIANGSTFIEMDTMKLSFYDEEGKQWL